MTQDVWLESHPYLRPVADFHAQVAMAAASIPCGSSQIPNWDNYRGDYQAGIPLLRSAHAAIDFEPAEAILVSLVESMASKLLPEKLALECRASGAQLRSELNAPRRAVTWLLVEEAFIPAHPGLLRYLGWTALARFLCPLGNAFDTWREDELLSHLRYAARNGPVSWDRSRPIAPPFLRLLRHALAIPANWVPVLRKHGRSWAFRPGDRGRELSSHRVLPVVRGLSQNL